MLTCKGGPTLEQFFSVVQFPPWSDIFFSELAWCTPQVSFSSEYITPRHIKILITLVKDYFDIEGTRLGNIAYIILTWPVIV